jgi:hypothetical protein
MPLPKEQDPIMNNVFVRLLRQCSYVPYAAFTRGGNYMLKLVLRNLDFVTNSNFEW